MSCKSKRGTVEQGPGTTGSKATSARSVLLNRQWLTQNASQYREQWVAIKDGKLLDHDSCSRTLRKRLRERHVPMDGVLVIMPGHFYNERNQLIW
jgi:hypothetical protein